MLGHHFHALRLFYAHATHSTRLLALKTTNNVGILYYLSTLQEHSEEKGLSFLAPNNHLLDLHSNTLSQYNAVIKTCQAVFEKKTQDYGTAWRALRLPSMTDQIMIKARRIRTIQEQKTQRIDEGIATELVGIVNYSVIALIQMHLQDEQRMELGYNELAPLYEAVIATTTALLNDKNHDYQEAWRSMRLGSITDIILMKLLRLKRIEDNQGTTLVSEGVAANYQDIINYAVFALIKLNYGDQ